MILMWWEENPTCFPSWMAAPSGWWWSSLAFSPFVGYWRWLADPFVCCECLPRTGQRLEQLARVFMEKKWGPWSGGWSRSKRASASYCGEQTPGLWPRMELCHGEVKIVSDGLSHSRSGRHDMWILIYAWASSRWKGQRWTPWSELSCRGQRCSPSSGQGLSPDTVLHQI